MKPEIENALKTILTKLTISDSSEGVFDKILKVLNSGVVVSGVFGILISATTLLLTQCNANIARKREVRLEDYHTKQRIMESFFTGINQYLRSTLSMKKREVFLGDWQDQPTRDTVKYPDGRSFEQTRQKYEEDKQFLNEHPPPDPTALTFIVEVNFTDSLMHERAKSLRKAIHDYLYAKDYSEIDQAYNSVYFGLEAVTSIMSDELNATRKQGEFF
jgi:hypothetical protein